jgi:hypothetical protein
MILTGAAAVQSETEAFPPTVLLDEKNYPPNNPNAPLLYFGYGIKRQDLVDNKCLMAYAKKQGLIMSECPPELRVAVALEMVFCELKTKFRCSIYLSKTRSKKYLFIIAVACNWTLEWDSANEVEMLKALDYIRSSVLDDDKQDAMWYHDHRSPYDPELANQLGPCVFLNDSSRGLYSRSFHRVLPTRY